MEKHDSRFIARPCDPFVMIRQVGGYHAIIGCERAVLATALRFAALQASSQWLTRTVALL